MEIEERKVKAAQEARLLALNPKVLQSLKGGKEFIKKQDAEMKVLNREHAKSSRKQKSSERKGFINIDGLPPAEEAEYAGLKEAEYVSLNKAKYAGSNQAKYDRLIPSEICIQAEYDICQAKYVSFSSSEICCRDLFSLGLTSGIRACEKLLSKKNNTIQSGRFIQNVNGPVSITTDNTRNKLRFCLKNGRRFVPEKEMRNARDHLLTGRIPEDHLGYISSSIDEAEKRCGCHSNLDMVEMTIQEEAEQMYILKQQFEGFSVSNSEGLHKGCDRFQSLLSQLEIHGAGVSTEDANIKTYPKISLLPGQKVVLNYGGPNSRVDSLALMICYNIYRVFESDVEESVESKGNQENRRGCMGTLELKDLKDGAEELKEGEL
ncbi:hypothetical protein Tco_0864098 [Tanacetum coccineum]